MITPNTNIRLLKVPFEIARKNQLTFASLTAQTTYFLSLPHLEYDNTTYQRQNNIIRFEAPIDDIRTYNYVMYKNESYSNKWFYAYITNMEYKNDNTTDLTIQTDVFQTWQFDIVYNTMFVEREHVNDDSVGANIVEEDLETGEFIANKHTLSGYLDDLVIVMGTTLNINSYHNNKYDKIKGDLYNNIYSGVKYFSWYNKNYIDGVSPYNRKRYIEGLNDVLQNIDLAGQGEGVLELFLVPQNLISPVRDDNVVVAGNTIDEYEINGQDVQYTHLLTITDGNLDGYVPVNNKLKCFPYRYLIASNNNGGEVTYKYEDFYIKNEHGVKILLSQPRFNIEGAICPGCSIRIIPLKYKGIDRNDIEGLNMGKFPTLSWNSDIYTNWVTQNGVNMAVETTANIGSIIVGGYTAPEGGGTGIVSGITGIAKTLGTLHEKSLTPNQAKGNLNCGDVIAGSKQNEFHFYDMSIKKEMALILDNFFSMFGYKVNNVKVPNITGRTNWNYVKTIDCNITGEIPQEDLQELKDMFDGGVTFWHNPSTFLDYSQSNAIVT
ncbi:MAG: hypothetical protein IKU37_09050 [Candidatus Gastranaerophilales bacterium]|nr:hypothetical protein [Candidatus Gastranaerophilales bacterium]